MRSFRKWSRRLSRHLKVALITGCHLCLSVEKKNCWARLAVIAWGILTGMPLTPARRREMAPFYFRRLAICRRCNFFDRHLRTCGTPGSVWTIPVTKEVVTVGCWCNMEIKSWYPHATCWAYGRDFGEPTGWPAHLNDITLA